MGEAMKSGMADLVWIVIGSYQPLQNEMKYWASKNTGKLDV